VDCKPAMARSHGARDEGGEEMIDLKPCPNCDGEAEFIPPDFIVGLNALCCTGCPLMVEDGDMTDEELADIWNNLPRHTP